MSPQPSPPLRRPPGGVMVPRASRLTTALLFAGLLLGLGRDAWALRPPGLYQVLVSAPTLAAAAAAATPGVAPNSPKARANLQELGFQEGLRLVLVRITGTRESAADPAFAPLLADARRYVQGFRNLADGGIDIVFDGPSLEKAMKDSGRQTWNADRPLTLVLLRPQPDGDVFADAAQRMQVIADSRGLPVSLALGRNMASEDTAGERDSLLPAAQRLGANAVLLGRRAGAGWQWSLYSPTTTQTWTGTLEEGAQGAADALARADLQAQSEPEIRIVLEVQDVRSAADYATLLGQLSALPGVALVKVDQARPDGTLVLGIVGRGAASLGAALSGAAALEPVASPAAATADAPRRVRFRH